MKINPLTHIAGLLLLAGALSVQAANTTFTTTTTATGNWSLGANWVGTAPTGNQAGNIAANGNASISLILDVATTIGQIKDTQSSAHGFTVNASGSIAMTMDNTGGTANPAGDLNSFIGSTSSGGVSFNPNIIIANKDLDLYLSGSTSPTLTIGPTPAGTGSIIANSPQNLNVFSDNGGSAGVTINDTVGSSGSVITVINQGTGARALTLAGVVGPNAAVTQNSSTSGLNLNAANSYTGATTITLGTLTLGVANAIPSGSSVSVAGALNLNGKSDNIDGLSGAGTVDATTGTITLGIGYNGSGGTFSGVIKNTSGTLSLTKSGIGTEILSGLNTYTGTTTISGGILAVASAETAGIQGPLGKQAANAVGTIFFGGGTLQYKSGNVVSGNVNDYSGRFSAASQTIKIDTDGQTPTFGTALMGSTAGSLTVNDSAGSPGTLTLNATEAYTGGTTINAGGTLVLSSTASLASGSSITINAGGQLDVSAITSPYNLGSSATLTASGTGTTLHTTEANLVAASGGTFSLGTQPVNLTWGGSGTGGSTTPCLNISQGTLSFNGNAITVSGPVGGLGAGTYTLITTSGTGALNGTAPVVTVSSADLVAGDGVTATTLTSSSLTITIGAVGAVGTWNGAVSGNWSAAGNWTGTGTLPPQAAGDAAIFGTGSSPVNLDANESVGTITFNTATAFTISGSSTLTLDKSGSGALVSMTSAAGTPAVIAPPLSLNDNATLTVNSGKTLNLSGVVSSTSTTKTLTVNGAGTTILGNANTYGPAANSTGTTLSGGGTLQVGNSTALSTGDLSVTGSSTLQAGAASLSVANNIAVGSSQTATVDNNTYGIGLGGIISGSGALNIINAGITTLGGANTYSGGTVISGGVVSISADGTSVGSSGNPGVVPASATANNLVLSGGDLVATANTTLHANRGVGIGATSGSTPGTGLLDAASGVTLTINGVIASAGNTGANSLTLNSGSGHTGTVVLGGANTIKGTTTISAGTLKLANSSALQNSTLSYSSGTLDFGTLTAATLGGLTGSQNLALANDSSAAVALTIGNNDTTSSYLGVLSGSGSLDKTGAGTFAIGSSSSGGASYTGATAVDNGTLTLDGNGGVSMNAGANNFYLSGLLGACTMNLLDSAIVTTTGGVYLASAGGSSYPAACTLTVQNSASLSVASLHFGNGTRVPNGNSVTVSGGTLSVSGVFDLFNTEGATTGTTAVNLNGGILGVGNFIASSFGSGGTHAISINFNGGTLQANANDPSGSQFLPVVGNTTASVNSGGAIINPNGHSITISQPLVHGAGTPDGGLTLNGTGTLTLNSLGNTYTGKTTIEGGGTLNINSEYALGGAVYGGLIFNNGTLQYNSSLLNATTDISQNSAAMPVAQTVTFTSNATIDVNGQNVTFANTIGNSGTGGLTVKSTAANGVLTLNGANLYSGNTTVSSGTLAVNNTTGSGTGSGSVTVQTAATLTGNGTISGAATINSGGFLAPGNGASGTLTLGASPTLNGTLAFGINKTAGPVLANSQLALGANNLAYGGALTVTLNGGALALASGDSFTLVTSSHTSPAFSGWFSSVTLPTLASGVAWDTNDLATSGVLDVYSFTTTPLTVSTLASTAATIPAAKLAGHASSSKGSTYPTGWMAEVSGAGLGSASFDGSGNLIYTAGATPGTDNLTVTFFDGHGSQTMAVTVTINAENVGPGLSPDNGYLTNGGYGSFTASGIPNESYDVEVATSMSGPWVPATNGTVQAAPNGVISYTDTETISAYGGMVFYRLKQQ